MYDQTATKYEGLQLIEANVKINSIDTQPLKPRDLGVL